MAKAGRYIPRSRIQGEAYDVLPRLAGEARGSVGVAGTGVAVIGERQQRVRTLRTPRKRHAPKSAPAIAVLKGRYPPDGRPSREDVPDSKLKRDYHNECDRRGIHKNDRVSDTQLLRCAGRKKT